MKEGFTESLDLEFEICGPLKSSKADLEAAFAQADWSFDIALCFDTQAELKNIKQVLRLQPGE